MPRDTAVLDALADLIEYPRDGHAGRTAELAARVVADLPEAGSDLEPFVRYATERDLGECEELYVRTFDGNADTALETGWQVFGEQYARGAFLVRLRERMRALGVSETSELPDHMTHVLRLVGRMERDEAVAIAGCALGPSLVRVRAKMDPENPYAGVLAATAKAAARIAPPEPVAAAVIQDFRNGGPKP